jgi:hypothetical protein
MQSEFHGPRLAGITLPSRRVMRRKPQGSGITPRGGDGPGHARRCQLLQFKMDTLKQRPLWVRLISEFLGTFLPVTVAAVREPPHRGRRDGLSQ